MILEVAILEMKVMVKNNADGLTRDFGQVMKEKKRLEMNDKKLSAMI